MKVNERDLIRLLAILLDSCKLPGNMGGYDSESRITLYNRLINDQDEELSTEEDDETEKLTQTRYFLEHLEHMKELETQDKQDPEPHFYRVHLVDSEKETISEFEKQLENLMETNANISKDVWHMTDWREDHDTFLVHCLEDIALAISHWKWVDKIEKP